VVAQIAEGAGEAVVEGAARTAPLRHARSATAIGPNLPVIVILPRVDITVRLPDCILAG
jgi:hypothetical protein